MARIHLSMALLAAAALVGCSRPQAKGPVVFVPVVERDFAPERPAPELPPAPKPEERPGVPQIHIAALFVDWPADRMAAFGVDPAKPATILAEADATKLLAQVADSAQGTVLAAPQLTALSGQPATIQVLSPRPYLAGYDFGLADPAKGLAPEPLEATIQQGLTLAVRAVADGRAVAFTRIDARMTDMAELFDCQAVMPAGRRDIRLRWQEPAILTTSTHVPDPCRIELGPGQTLIVPVRLDPLVLRRSNVRALVKEGKARMRRDPAADFLARLDRRGYPVRGAGQLYVVLTASLAQGSASPPKPKAE